MPLEHARAFSCPRKFTLEYPHGQLFPQYRHFAKSHFLQRNSSIDIPCCTVSASTPVFTVLYRLALVAPVFKHHLLVCKISFVSPALEQCLPLGTFGMFFWIFAWSPPGVQLNQKSWASRRISVEDLFTKPLLYSRNSSKSETVAERLGNRLTISQWKMVEHSHGLYNTASYELVLPWALQAGVRGHRSALIASSS